MDVCGTPSELDRRLEPARRGGRRIGFVPTMGALHEGHLSLVRTALEQADLVVASIFVNPLQFGPGEDFGAYPRDLDGDLSVLDREGVSAVLAPPAGDFAPRNVTVSVVGLTDVLEGIHRPGHFDGVATIVAKLFNVVRPDVAFFGEKDYQQLLVIRRMAAELGAPVEVVGCPTVREPDGLALSSRNAYLSAGEREQAVALSRTLFAVRDAWDGDADSARETLRHTLGTAPGVRLDYAEICDPATLESLHGVVSGPARALVAARVGSTRLIDNVRLDPPPAG